MKIIKVKNCKECPKALLQRCTLKVMGNEEYKYIPNREYHTIPDWCPLENLEFEPAYLKK